MNLIIETDLGHDPDDFFAICYLIAAGVNIRCITICPGDPDQIALADLIRDRTGRDFTIGVSHPEREKMSSGGIHHKLLHRHGKSLYKLADGMGMNLIAETLESYPDSELLVIGPASSIGQLLSTDWDKLPTRATIQGGFLGYHQHDFPCLRLDKFEGLSWCPTFNLNGDRKGAITVAESGIPLQYVSKNLCHTIEFNKEQWHKFQRNTVNPAADLFADAANLYFDKHDSKKFHDPTAAVCHLHPEIADWVRGYMVKIEGGWGTVIDPSGHHIIADINRHLLWKHLSEFS